MSQLAWMVSLLPESIFVFLMYTLLLCGGLLYAASKLVSWIPLMSQYHLPAELAAVALLLVSVYFFGWYGNEAQWQARIKELEAKVAAAEAKSREVNTVIQTRILTKIKTVKEIVYVNKELIKEVAGKQLDAKCELPMSTVFVHDSASQNEVSRGPGSVDGTPSAVKASDLLGTVVENYGTYYEIREKLIGWQEWYKEQKKTFEEAQK